LLMSSPLQDDLFDLLSLWVPLLARPAL
jgi:hypothetical protein